MKRIILALIVLVLISGCSDTYRYVTNCNECIESEEWCYESLGMIPSYQCIKYDIYDININETIFNNNESYAITINKLNESIFDTEKPFLDYDKLNYTTLNITREEFEALPKYRQRDWLSGVCYPANCKSRNPPVCVMFYAVHCINLDSPESKYFNNLYLE